MRRMPPARFSDQFPTCARLPFAHAMYRKRFKFVLIGNPGAPSCDPALLPASTPSLLPASFFIWLIYFSTLFKVPVTHGRLEVGKTSIFYRFAVRFHFTSHGALEFEARIAAFSFFLIAFINLF